MLISSEASLMHSLSCSEASKSPLPASNLPVKGSRKYLTKEPGSGVATGYLSFGRKTAAPTSQQLRSHYATAKSLFNQRYETAHRRGGLMEGLREGERRRKSVRFKSLHQILFAS